MFDARTAGLLIAACSLLATPAEDLDPLHHTAVLEPGEAAASVEVITDFEGTLHVWVASAEIDPDLRVEIEGTDISRSDGNSGGVTTAYLRLEVSEGQVLTIQVSSETEETGSAELHWIAAPETDATRELNEGGQVELKRIKEFQAAGEHDEVRARLNDLLDEIESTDGHTGSELLSELCWYSGYVAWELTMYELASRAWQVTHEFRERSLPGDHLELLNVKSNIAAARSALLDYDGALELTEYTCAAYERLLPAEHSRVIRNQGMLGQARYNVGDYEGALELLRHVEEVWGRLKQADDLELLWARGSLAAALRMVGELEEAAELMEAVHASRVRLLPADDFFLLNTRLNLGIVRSDLGDLQGGLALVESVHAAWERQFGSSNPDHPLLLRATHSLAALRSSLGDFEGALELAESVLAARERSLPANHPAILRCRHNVAVDLERLGDVEAALELLESVHATESQRLDPEDRNLLDTKMSLASMATRLGDFERARQLEESVYEVRQRTLPAEHPDLLLVENNLGRCLQHLGDFAGARELQEHVHEVRERLLPSDHPLVLLAKVNLAGTRSALGDLEGGHRLTLEVLAGLTRRAAELSRESPRVARSSARKELEMLPEVIRLCDFQQPDSRRALIRELFAALESLRAASTDSMEIAQACAQGEELRAMRRIVAAARRRAADAVLSMPEDADGIQAWREEILALAEERDELQRELRRNLADRGMRFEAPTVERVAQGLDSGAVFVSFFRHPDLSIALADLERVDVLKALVVTPRNTVSLVDLGPCEELELLAHRWRGATGRPVDPDDQLRGLVVAPVPRPETDDTKTADTVGRTLRERLLDPCLAALGAEIPTSIHLVLDDFLLTLPLDALPGEDGAPLGESIPIRLEVSARRLVTPTAQVTRTGTLLALGGVDYDATDVPASDRLLGSNGASITLAADRSAAPGPLALLAETSAEARSVADLYEGAFDLQSVLLVQAAATKRAFVEHASDARFLHIATHGWFAPLELRSILDESPAVQLGRTENTVAGFLPEALCGLAFAGANQGANEQGHVPGILTAEELSALDLSNCELAVLSACETNVGLRRAGQGIQSLQTALHGAGVRTAITSLWKVPDAATRRLMELFYENLWQDNLGKADALWQAKMTLRNEGAPLQHWSGWVLTGNPN